ncbi:uncharacterized protein LOC143295252 [Babylonia areolata]|uniref:uncharacterized protein LOC143295252 n=1 Tax=Babylonia areolata TaxID=304850 RepID=UPI003FD35BCF
MLPSLLSPSRTARLWVCCWLFSGAVLSGARAYSSGAPDSRCSSMVPGHWQAANTYTDPFRVTVSADTYSPLKLLTVTIQPTVSNIYIRGFLLQARPASDRNSGTTVGFFTSGSSTQTACNSGAITHSYSTDRSNVTVSWRAPAVPQGDIVFRATVVRVYNDFYTQVDSSVVSVELPTTTTTTTTPITTTSIPTTPTTTASTTTTPTTTTTTPTTPTTTTTTPTTTTTTATTTTTTTLPSTAPSTTTTLSPTTVASTTMSETTTTSTQASSTAVTSGLSSHSTSSDGGTGTSTTRPPTSATSTETNDGPVSGAGMTRCSRLIFLLLLLLLTCVML